MSCDECSFPYSLCQCQGAPERRAQARRSAAPEHTAPRGDVHEQLVQMSEALNQRDEALRKLAAANARIAELEREGMAAHDAYNEALHREAAANARADAAERRCESLTAGHIDYQRRAARFESEAAALRAELADQITLANGALDAQGEAEQKWFAARSGLSTATDLLRDGLASRDMFWQQRAHAFLSTAPVPTGREAAEREWDQDDFLADMSKPHRGVKP